MWHVFIPVALVSTLVIGIVIASAVRDVTAARRWVTIAVVGIAAFPVAIVVHNVLSAIMGREEAVSFVIALLVAPGFMAVGTLGAALALARDPRLAQVGRPILLGGAGVALFALYALLGPAITVISGEDKALQAVVEAVVLPLSAGALAVGAALGALARLRVRSRHPRGATGPKDAGDAPFDPSGPHGLPRHSR